MRPPSRSTATEALIVPMGSPETNVDFILRMSAVKANTEPNVIIMPKSDQVRREVSPAASTPPPPARERHRDHARAQTVTSTVTCGSREWVYIR